MSLRSTCSDSVAPDELPRQAVTSPCGQPPGLASMLRSTAPSGRMGVRGRVPGAEAPGYSDFRPFGARGGETSRKTQDDAHEAAARRPSPAGSSGDLEPGRFLPKGAEGGGGAARRTRTPDQEFRKLLL